MVEKDLPPVDKREHLNEYFVEIASSMDDHRKPITVYANRYEIKDNGCLVFYRKGNIWKTFKPSEYEYVKKIK